MMLCSARVSRRRLAVVAHRLLATLIAVLFLLPLLWALSASLHETDAGARRSFGWVPSPTAWDNYREVFHVVDLLRYAANSLFIIALAVPITIVVASWAGFVISQLSRGWRWRFIALSVLCLMVPLTAIWLPRFILFKEAGLIDRRIALVVPALMGTSPFYVLLFAWAFLRIPREIYEAARLDGAMPWRMWRDIALPLARPAIVAVAVLSAIHYWNSVVEPLLLIRTDANNTASLGLRVLYSLDRSNWPLIMTGAIVVLAPVVLVFVLAQRAFLQDGRGLDRLGY
jgi:ABC-type glycerol-3-phosphate transport system permease component